MSSRALSLQEIERAIVDRGRSIDAEGHRDRDHFVAAVERGLADVAAGRVIDDDELDGELDAEFGPLA